MKKRYVIVTDVTFLKEEKVVKVFRRAVFTVTVAFAICGGHVFGNVAAQSQSAVGFSQDVAFARFPDKASTFTLSLDELVSARGEDERYAPCDLSVGDVKLDSSCVRRSDADAWDACATVTNRSNRSRFLRLVFRANIPFPTFTFWNGYLNQSNVEKVEDGPISSLFPRLPPSHPRRRSRWGSTP